MYEYIQNCIYNSLSTDTSIVMYMVGNSLIQLRTWVFAD